jgi:hypothetical protein
VLRIQISDKEEFLNEVHALSEVFGEKTTEFKLLQWAILSQWLYPVK